MNHPFIIKHDPSGDEAEADTREAATLAARTLLEDNSWLGQCRIFRGENVLDMVWADEAEHFTHLSCKEAN